MLIKPLNPRTRNQILIEVWIDRLHYSKSDSFSQANQLNCSNRTRWEQALKTTLPINHPQRQLLWIALNFVPWELLIGWLSGWLAAWLAWKMHKYLTVCTDNQNKATFEINFIADQQQLASSCSCLAVGAQMLTWYAICMLVAPNCRILAVFLLLLLPLPLPLLFACVYFWADFLLFLAIVNTKLLPTGQKCWRNCRKMEHKL